MSEFNSAFYQKCLSWARVWGEGEYAGASQYKYAAFANAVAYLCTGGSGGYGGPSVREHAVSWALSGPEGYQALAQTDLGQLVVQYPDGSLPEAGQWEFEAACQFAAPLVFGPLANLHRRIWQVEHCFDDDPADLEQLR